MGRPQITRAQFNKQMLERKMSSEPQPELNLDEMDLDSMMAGDGSLPGGMTPEQVKKMASNPEMLKMMANPKLQEVMKVSAMQCQLGWDTTVANGTNEK